MNTASRDMANTATADEQFEFPMGKSKTDQLGVGNKLQPIPINLRTSDETV